MRYCLSSDHDMTYEHVNSQQPWLPYKIKQVIIPAWIVGGRGGGRLHSEGLLIIDGC